MEIYRYWAKVHVDAAGREVPPPAPGEVAATAFRGAFSSPMLTGAVGWSNQSPADARRHALERAATFARWFRHTPDRLQRWYAYANRPVREPILREMHRGDERIAALTRNAVGVTVLNAAEMFIADIDLPEVGVSGALRGLWGAITGRRGPSHHEQVQQRLEQAVAEHPGLAIRLYRTAGGHRAIVTSRPLAADAPEARRLLEFLGSDPLYVRLCEHQKCYRARLTPKPWRIGMRVNLGPFPPPEGMSSFDEHDRQWLAEYEQASTGWAVCEPAGTFGGEGVDAAIAPVLELHDAQALAPGRPLA